MTEIIRYTDINDMLKNIKRCGSNFGNTFSFCYACAKNGHTRCADCVFWIRQKTHLDEIGYSGKIYDVNNIDTDEVLKSILNAEPYKLDGNIIKSAENHI